MSCYLYLVLVLCCHITPGRAYHDFLQDLLHPFMICADENHILRDRSLKGNLNNDIDTLRMGFDPIMNCIDSKLAVFRTSDDTAEWYIGHMFNINTARHLKHNLTNSRPYNFICLNSDRYYHRRDLCLKSSNVTLKTAMDIAYNYNVSNGGIQYMICNGGEFTQLVNCMTVGGECAAGTGDFLQQVLFPILMGKYCDSRRSTIPPSPTPPFTTRTPSYVLNVEESSFFACRRVTFNDPLKELFPPSKSSVAAVPNTTVAKQSMQKFCLKHREYAQCVTQRIKGRNNLLDHLTDNVINVQNLEKAFKLYCENQDLILSQYKCVSNAVSGGTCIGGVDDLLAAGVRNMRTMTSTQVCRKMDSAVSCRLKTQLNQCSPPFVSVMQEFYNNILRDDCITAQNPRTDISKCFANYSLGLQARVSNNQSIIKEMEYICENEIEGMTDCMYRIYYSPKKTDVVISKLFAAKNIKSLARRLCALVPALKPNFECIGMGFETLASQPNNCLAAFQETMVSAMWNTTLIMEDIDTVASQMCRSIGSFKPCLVSVFTSCEQLLGNSIGALYDEMVAACNNPNYRLKDTSDSGGQSSSSKLSHTFIFILVPFAYASL